MTRALSTLADHLEAQNNQTILALRRIETGWLMERRLPLIQQARMTLLILQLLPLLTVEKLIRQLLTPSR